MFPLLDALKYHFIRNCITTEVVKKGGVDLQQRVVPVAAIASWYEKISGMEGPVGNVLGEEREEKEPSC